MTKKMIISGFGGQGVLTLGEIIAIACMNKELKVTWTPSYGAEMRGGSANCAVIVSDSNIGSPMVQKDADCLIAMNTLSFDKFLPKVKSGGLVIANSSMIPNPYSRDDVELFPIKATDIALELGGVRVSNMVALGAFIKKTNMFTEKEAFEAMSERFGTLAQINIDAIKRGLDS